MDLPAAGAPAQLAACADPFQAPLDDPDALRHETPVGLQLFLAGPAQADTTLLPLEMRPAPDQPRRQMLELRELHLQLAFESAGPLGEDVQNERDAIEHAAFELGLQVALLGRRERVIEDHDFGVVVDDPLANFVQLAAADEEASIGRAPSAGDRRHGQSTGGNCEVGELFEVVAAVTVLECDMNQYGTFAAIRSFEQTCCSGITSWCQCSSPSGPPSSSGLGNLTLRAGTTVEIACLYTIWLTVLRSSTTN